MSDRRAIGCVQMSIKGLDQSILSVENQLKEVTNELDEKHFLEDYLIELTDTQSTQIEQMQKQIDEQSKTLAIQGEKIEVLLTGIKKLLNRKFP